MDTEDDSLRIDGPLGLLPDLALWGIEPVDAGICEDTFDNRKLLRENKARWLPVYTQKGEPTNLIQVVTSEMRQAQLIANKSIILSDAKDTDSDYKVGFNLTIIPQSDTLVPAWVIAATKQWSNIEEERQLRGEGAKLYRPAIAGPPGRCRAKNITGHRCQNWHNGQVDSNGLCRTHMSNHHYDAENPGIHTMAKARARLLSAAEGAVEGLEELALNATSEPVRLGAYRDLLDRAGLRGGIDFSGEVKVTVVPAADLVKDRLDALRKRQIEMAEAEAEANRQRELEARTEDAEIVVEVETNGKTDES
jgi:hypothetical protein